MSNSDADSDPLAGASREDILAAHFASLVMQNVNMAMLCLGKMPHPETGQYTRDLDSARHFIDQLEMLEAKTKGNLDKREESLLKQSLTSLRLAFVDAASGAPPPQAPGKPEAAPSTAHTPQPAPPAGGGPSAPIEASPADPEAEARKKFVKKY